MEYVIKKYLRPYVWNPKKIKYSMRVFRIKYVWVPKVNSLIFANQCALIEVYQ